jgi:hypothetical protein
VEVVQVLVRIEKDVRSIPACNPSTSVNEHIHARLSSQPASSNGRHDNTADQPVATANPGSSDKIANGVPQPMWDAKTRATVGAVAESGGHDEFIVVTDDCCNGNQRERDG